jgi:hypothetical protein
LGLVTWAELVRKEWGAVTFVLTVLIGLIAVPLAFYVFHQGPAPVALPASSPSPSATASTSR